MVVNARPGFYRDGIYEIRAKMDKFISMLISNGISVEQKS
jgi:hypothetical protein